MFVQVSHDSLQIKARITLDIIYSNYITSVAVLTKQTGTAHTYRVSELTKGGTKLCISCGSRYEMMTLALLNQLFWWTTMAQKQVNKDIKVCRDWQYGPTVTKTGN